MSGNSYRSYSDRSDDYTPPVRGFDSPTREREFHTKRKERVEKARSDISKGRAAPAPKRNVEDVYDRQLARNTVTEPKPGTKRVHVVLIDNSGSNRRIANHLQHSSGYLLATLGAIDPDSQICFMYFSDHCDGPQIMQPVDYVSPDEQGDKILHSSIRHVKNAGGGDAPEAIECALIDACEIPFGDVWERHLYLVTDVVAHGMGMREDDGCPRNRNVEDSLELVKKTFVSFQVIGCGNDPQTAQLQRKFITNHERLPYDLVDLSAIDSHTHRCGITGNAVLFLIARHQGNQAVEAFLMALYEKWLTEPIFGANTDLSAREAIQRFTKYLEMPKDEQDRMLIKIFS